MTTELTLLAWTIVLALVYILAFDIVRTRQYGLKWNTGARDAAMPPLTPFADRLGRAQANLFETLPLFAAAVLIAHSRRGAFGTDGARRATLFLGAAGLSPAVRLRRAAGPLAGLAGQPCGAAADRVRHPVTIRVGVGGWTFAPWRGSFYPNGLGAAKELGHASRVLTAIEVNATFYSTMAPATYARWHAETPDNFMFSLKGPRYAVNRRVLAEAGESVQRFVASGIDRLGDKLGPLLWQLAATKAFDPDDIARFLDLLPARLGDRPLRHVLEPRHPSFADPRLTALAVERGIAIAYADADAEQYPVSPRPDRRFHLCPAAERGRSQRVVLPRRRARRLGRAGAGVGRGRTRRLRVLHPRRQDPRARGGDGVDRAAMNRSCRPFSGMTASDYRPAKLPQAIRSPLLPLGSVL